MTGTQKEKTNKHWTTWFYGDPHFGHQNVIKYCNRPFGSVQEMNEALVSNYNRLVHPDDHVIFLGDVFFYHTKEQMKEILNRLSGKKFLVRGNHDQEHRIMMNAGFELSVDEMVMKIAGERVHFSHYPFKMEKKLFQWIRLKSKVKRWIRWLGFDIKPTFFEKYHHLRPEDKGQFLIHGHSHSKNKINGRAINVGVDCRGYRPVNIQEISNEIAQIKKNGPVYIKYQDSNED